ncbi:tetratricopeptide repeat-containing sensor histidine kinase [Aquimarina sediminis]|uniref:tetratricopeptide repeat-containing sensor histidine kinase n=1 Tax=Aquimarina sediminis TaxID=2070536 RepID=UPI0013E8A7C6|nr:tetratricopeptide repeat protein [Aquimarina sediminis]
MGILQQLALELSDSDPARALGYAHQGLELLEDENSKNIGYFYFILGRLCNGRSEFEQALFYYNKTMEIAKGLRYEQGVAKSHQSIGLVYVKMGNYHQALDEYLKAANIYEASNERGLQIGALENVGSLYSLKLKDDENALLYYNKALKLSEKIGDIEYRTGIMIAVAEVYMRQKNFEKAKKVIKESIEIAEKTNIPPTIMTGLSNLSAIAVEENKLQEALVYAKKSLKLRLETGEVYENAIEYLRLADIYEKLGDTIAAISHYDEALSTAIETKALPQLSKVYESLQGYYRRQKDYQKGYEYLLKYNIVKDSLFNEEKKKELKEVQAKFDIESKEREVQLLINENKIKALENKSHRITRILLIIGLFALSIILLTLLYGYRNKQRTNGVLAEKNKEISQTLKDREILLKEVHHRVKNNLQIVSSLLRLQYKFGDHKSSVEILQEIQNKIQAMAIIHERLYKSNDLSLINLGTYLDNLLNYFKTSYDLSQQNITISTDVDNINLDMDYLVPCGLIVNEIIANSIKYAFEEDASGHISIEASKNEDTCVLMVKDSGVGFPENFEMENSQSLGMQLIQGLTRQIKGTVEIDSNPGACYTIKFDMIM